MDWGGLTTSLIIKEDLVSNTPYNTYQNYGLLPPTLIDMPSRGSILAAVNPTPEGASIMWLGGWEPCIFRYVSKAYREKYQQNDKEIIIIPPWAAPYLSLGEKYGR